MGVRGWIKEEEEEETMEHVWECEAGLRRRRRRRELAGVECAKPVEWCSGRSTRLLCVTNAGDPVGIPAKVGFLSVVRCMR